MKIIIDAMGGDNAPYDTVKGAVDASNEIAVDILLCGASGRITEVFDKMGFKDVPPRVEIANASQIIEMDDEPTAAVRAKKDSSLAVALNLLRDGQGDALVSAGNTGAVLTGATLIVGRVPGIRRAAMAPIVPNTVGGGFVLIDCGATAECTPEYLLQFALMGSLYAQDALKIAKPRVGLLNIGAETSKGTALQLETYPILEKACKDGHINFIGNVEAKEAMKNACDVLVSDGYTGNILLKTIEGTASLIMSGLKDIFNASMLTKLSALIVKNRFRGLRDRISSDAVGGTALLGIAKPVIKAHGSSNAAAIKSAIRQAAAAAGMDAAARLSERLAEISEKPEQ